ncbi:hypothetical protein [Jiulongibacter sp. NS-SX5]|uniref:hypothetical protein n=1 Tax=Jiulongibacter sp. NS-SX5 TaxID=3463854 RepID=UPI00405A2C98
MKKYLNTIILFGSLAFLIMWVDRIVYKGEELKYNYFFLMFALAGFLYYTYRRGLAKMKEKEEEEKTKKKPKRKSK